MKTPLFQVWRRLPALLAACCVVAGACGQSLPEPAAAPRQETPLVGDDGEVTVTLPGVVLNRYAVLAANAAAGSTRLELTNIQDLDHPTFGPLGIGDLVLIIQMQGASIDTSDSAAYGAITNLHGAGFHEFAVVRGVENNTVTLACNGLEHSYSVAGRTQVVRVPQLTNLFVESGGTVVAAPWDGLRGGVVAIHVAGVTNLSGSIDVSGQGFRAGARENTSGDANTLISLYRSSDAAAGAEKGEGIAGDSTVYDTLGGRYGRGAPANGGGGGNSHNAGGGGGSNGNNSQPWDGQGVMSGSVPGALAWQLDPGFISNGNARTNDSGGGRGGYTYSTVNADAFNVGPNDAAWGGNSRSEVGGLGGRPLNNEPGSRLFLGGGGGAGDGNNNAGAAGGNGGGLVYLISSTVSGEGQVLANGSSAQNTTGSHNDAPGGGGAGGSIVILSSDLSGVSVEANGGRGGNQLITSDEAEGPGGGGGGGYIALRGGTGSTSVLGGFSGTSTSSSVTEFPANGATAGGTGQVVQNTPEVPTPWLSCDPTDTADLSINLTATPNPVSPGSDLTYTVQVGNAGPDTANAVTVTFPVPAGTTFSSVGGAGWTCAAAGGVVTCTLPSLAIDTTATFTIVVVPTAQSGSIIGSATVTSPTPDPTSENNNDTETTGIAATNDAPVNTVPGPQTTPEDTPLVFSPANGNPVSIADPDAGTEPVQVTLTVTNGTLTLGSTPGLTFTEGDGASDTKVTFTGTQADINAALAGLTFTPDANYNGPATLTLTTNDQGNSGDGGPLSDTDTVEINVTPVNDAPTAVDDTASVPFDSAGQTLDVLANDSFAPDSGETLTIIEVTQGSEGGTVTITENGTRVTYTPAPGFEGSETFTYTISDGNGGTSTATVTITVKRIERRVVGRGCSASGSGGLSGLVGLLLALFVLPRRGQRGSRSLLARLSGALFVLCGGVLLTSASPAWAQSSAIDVQQFKPAPGQSDVLGLHGAGVPGHLSWRAGLYLNYAHEPLVIINPATDDLLQHLVKNQLGFDLMGSLGLGKYFELGAVIPVNLQHGEFEQTPNGSLEQKWKGGLGDLRLVPKAVMLEEEKLRVAFALPIVLPSGGSGNLRGQDGAGVQPRLTADYSFEGGTRVLANVGVNFRSRQELLNLSVGNELSYGLGAAIPFQLRGQQFTGMASVAGAMGLGATGGANEEEVPLEMQAGVQYHFNKSVLATLGLGRGLTLGYGMPAIRVFSGVSWTAEAPPPVIHKDSDNDGLLDEEDTCPNEPEDRDGFQDEDGCPDLDNDQDGIPDTADKCPNEPEDKDGFQDEDGCPDPDNDQDGLADAADKCPLEAEDKDGFQDADGCPDPDNDQDGLADTADKCPLKPEDKDGFQDEDGCPDPDNDRDGVADADDQCPEEAEVINGVEDTDGCPDVGETKVKVTGNRITIKEKVYFATNKDVVLARSFPLLQQVGLVLKANPQLTKVRIEGHTDDRADDAFNLDLSQRRAGSVLKYLVEQANIDPERLEAVGYGETQPVDTNKTEQGRENNRRVQFTILTTDDEAQ
ncbi:Ig-like domain-containing protein [Hyalangium rubrum]|uniref:Ig-like domain-containing protein n=1 Tax=Hyalangium rubrum TaxID=3103134 RepID=A0ABU5H6N4_9BACT|nr:Ig-like domain-containing protein [Hyalangium sp. s54d21]MDY7229133.1 Ig-like domain-containing protein [Hyalangium sp. s54d21]